jgi:hypothetical protein
MKNFKVNMDNLTATHLFHYEPTVIPFNFFATLQYILIFFTRVLQIMQVRRYQIVDF